MSELYDKIDIARSLEPQRELGITAADRQPQVVVGLELAARAAQPKEPEIIKAMPSVMPIPN